VPALNVYIAETKGRAFSSDRINAGHASSLSDDVRQDAFRQDVVDYDGKALSVCRDPPDILLTSS